MNFGSAKLKEFMQHIIKVNGQSTLDQLQFYLNMLEGIDVRNS